MISYRPAIQLDLPVLVSMERVLFADSPWSMGQFKEAFKGVPNSRYFLVATNEADQIVGYAAVLVVAPGVEADVLTVAVLPDYARQGIATHFMNELEKWSKGKQALAMMLERALRGMTVPTEPAGGAAAGPATTCWPVGAEPTSRHTQDVRPAMRWRSAPRRCRCRSSTTPKARKSGAWRGRSNGTAPKCARCCPECGQSLRV